MSIINSPLSYPVDDAPRFRLFQRARLVDIHAQPLRSNLADRPGKPPSRPCQPAPTRPRGHDADGHRGVVERLGGDGVGGRKAEDDGDEDDPEHRD